MSFESTNKDVRSEKEELPLLAVLDLLFSCSFCAILV